MDFKNFGLSELKLNRFENKNGLVNHIKLGSPVNFFAMIEAGTARFSSTEGTVELLPHELLYIPKGLIYTSEWFGAPACRFYSFGFSFRHFSENARFALQKLSADTLAACGIGKEDFAQAHQSEGTWKLLALFYHLYTSAAPLFTPRRTLNGTGELYPALRQMEEAPAGDFDVPALARLCGMSESKFYDAFKKSTGHTPMAYKNILRARQALELLTNTDLTVEEIAAQLACSSPSYLRRILADTVGKTPKEIRREKQTL